MTVYIMHRINDDLTNACVASWLEQTSDIVVIDSASPIPYKSERVRVHYLPVNMGLIDANNEGMKAYPSPWYVCSNNDVFPASGCLERLLAAFDDPEVGIAAPGSSDNETGVLYVAPDDADRYDVVTEQVDNHCIVFMQDVIDEIGWPTAKGHPHYANWASNKEFCYRARKAGYKIMAVRSAYVEHRRVNGYDPVADAAGREWLQEYLGDKFHEAW